LKISSIKISLLLLIYILTLTFNILPVKSINSEVLFFDDFNDGVADGWTEHLGTWNVINGEYFVTVGIVENGISTVDDLTLDDCIIETRLRFRDTSVGFRAGIVFRYTDNEHYYAFQISNEYDKVSFKKYTPEAPEYGEFIIENDYPVYSNVDYILRVEVHGDRFTGFINGDEVLSSTDKRYKYGKVGLRARRADVFFDDFIVHNVETFPTPDLVGYWKFNEGSGNTVYDSSGNNRDGTIHGAKWDYGKVDYALKFDGTDDYVSLPTLYSSRPTSLTVTAWIKSQFNHAGYIVYNGYNGEFLLHNGERLRDGPVYGRYPDLASFSVKLADGTWYDVYSLPLTPNTWHHLTGVWIKGVSLKIYVDGVLASENKAIPNYDLYDPGSNYYTSIGVYCRGRETDTFFEGLIDEVRVYIRALSDTEIKTLASATPQLFSLSVDTFKNDLSYISNITLFDENKTIIQTVEDVYSHDWLLDLGTYYVKASIHYNDFVYVTKQIKVSLVENTELAINFLFGNLTISCVDTKTRPIENCKILLIRDGEERTIYTNSSGLAMLEAYYGNWTVKVFHMAVLVGEIKVNIDSLMVNATVECNVGDLSVSVVDQYGRSVKSNVALNNTRYDLVFTGYIDESMENLTFTQIPLIDYDLTIKDDFWIRTYHLETTQTRSIRIEVVPFFQILIYIVIGIAFGVISSFVIWTVTKRR